MNKKWTLRTRKKVDYSQLADIKLPQEKKVRTKEAANDELYPIEIVERDAESNGRFKIHYVGYSSKFDEWRDDSEIVSFDSATSQGSMDTERPSRDGYSTATVIDTVVTPFSLYNELSIKVKCALSSRRKENPSTRIDMPFDKLLFDGGLKA